jgi:predicted ABC-class ATPase
VASADDLRRTLSRIDGRGYPAYKDLRGSYEFERLTLCVDHVQGDPFAAPSKLRLRVPAAVAALPLDLFENRIRRIALEDFLARRVRDAIRDVQGPGGRRGSGKSGEIRIDAGGQQVLERTAIALRRDWVEARIEVGLPAAGRRVLGRVAEEILCSDLPRVAERALCPGADALREAARFVECVENQAHIRAGLDARGLVAFVADGAILPRESGVSDRPLERSKAVAFESPESLRVTLDLPNAVESADGARASVTGMGIPKGVTLIVGGGYHGKSTLLRALERGVYAHVPGDGREGVVTAERAVKIRAEDGRRVERVDIAAFIGDLPYGRDTAAFSTDDASGSTSQAANIVEALEAGTTALLLDEDTSATNFMVRDARMQALVPREGEPITPFVDRVRELYERLGVSTVLVMGGCGDYLEAADTVIRMREYAPVDTTREAKRVAESHPTGRRSEPVKPLEAVGARVPLPASFDASRGRREVKIDARGVEQIRFGREDIDLRALDQLVDPSQARALGYAIHLAASRFMDERTPLCEVIEAVARLLDEQGLDALDPFRRGEAHPGNFARPRALELAAAINRLRSVRMRQRRDLDEAVDEAS